uniref:Bm14387 n=1 Tax=Brugia malayi TaxID=6279 RepID=A0A1I9G893_BRUMA|nr:Bm14387 [Brugia malayi]
MGMLEDGPVVTYVWDFRDTATTAVVADDDVDVFDDNINSIITIIIVIIIRIISIINSEGE